MDLQSLIRKIDDGDCALADFEKVASHTGDTVQQIFSKTALYFAKAFMNHEIDFDTADSALEWIFDAMLRRTYSTSESIADTIAFPIYIAFDAGEYDHGDGKDPVETYTIPQLQKILKELDENSSDA